MNAAFAAADRTRPPSHPNAFLAFTGVKSDKSFPSPSALRTIDSRLSVAVRAFVHWNSPTSHSACSIPLLRSLTLTHRRAIHCATKCVLCQMRLRAVRCRRSLVSVPTPGAPSHRPCSIDQHGIGVRLRRRAFVNGAARASPPFGFNPWGGYHRTRIMR
jgi:hypothetical protein